MNVVITAAGRGTRLGFRRDQDTIKPLATLAGKPILWWSISSLSRHRFDQIVIVVPHRERISENLVRAVRGTAIDALLHFDVLFNDLHIVEEKKLVQGQMTSALVAAPLLRKTEPFAIMPCDSAIHPSFFDYTHKLDGDFFGCISFYNFPGDRWSFILTDSNGLVIQIREKFRISNLCSTGYYHFNNMSSYVSLANDIISDNATEVNEYYVTLVYQKALALGYKIASHSAASAYEYGTCDSLANADVSGILQFSKSSP
jgi:NDP-sugar pyrophosphorylase family protein